MGLFLASKLTRLALAAAQTALAAGEAYRTGKKIEKRVREALRPQKEDVITMKKSTFAAILVFFAAIAGALTAAYMYLRRREAAGQCAERLGVPIIYADETWDITNWLRAVAGRDTPPARCAYCCESRMQAAFAFARQQGFAWVSSSLLYSRYQPHKVIKAAGEQLAAQEGAPGFAYRDFRADWQEGIDRSKAMELYRQPYCGCVYSEAERYQKKLLRCIKG